MGAPIVSTAHTIDDGRGGLLSGLLVRSSGRTLGYIWRAGSAWRWKTGDGLSFGERSSQKTALDVLADIAALRAGTLNAAPAAPAGPRAPRWAPPARPTMPARETPRQAPAPAPEPEPEFTAQPIVWSDAPDLTSTLASIFAKQRGGK